MQQANFFLRYVDDIVKTVKSDTGVVLQAANLLHPKLQFTIETQNRSGKLAFLDLQVIFIKTGKLFVDVIRNQQIKEPCYILEIAPLRVQEKCVETILRMR